MTQQVTDFTQVRPGMTLSIGLDPFTIRCHVVSIQSVDPGTGEPLLLIRPIITDPVSLAVAREFTDPAPDGLRLYSLCRPDIEEGVFIHGNT